MDKTYSLPFRNQFRLPFDHRFQKILIRIFSGDTEMALQRIIGEGSKIVRIAPFGCVFERANAQMTGRNTCQNSARLKCFTGNLFSRRHHREASGARNAKRMHGFADNVFP